MLFILVRDNNYFAEAMMSQVQKEQITYVKGDVTLPKTYGKKVIVHIVNNIGTWGKGFVLALSKRWKNPELEYRHSNSYDLGNIQIIRVEKDIEVINMIAQNGIKKYYHPQGQRYVDYDALYTCFSRVRAHITENTSVHMPRIGVGLGGGEWSVISKIIQQTLCDKGIKVFVYSL